MGYVYSGVVPATAVARGYRTSGYPLLGAYKMNTVSFSRTTARLTLKNRRFLQSLGFRVL